MLEFVGQKIYGNHFKIIEDDHDLIFKLLVYFMRDSKNAKRLGIDHRKGILLTGPIGCGKTSMMNLFRSINAQFKPHIMVTCRNITLQFSQEGHSVIQQFSDCAFRKGKPELEPITYCFDDLGVENTLKYFGNDCNVMAEILLSRHDYFISHGMITHLTTNLNSAEIESFYGNRIRSRLRQLMNIIAYPNDASDKR